MSTVKSTVDALEAGLKQYYKQFNKKYNGEVKAYMDDCGLDEDGLTDDFASIDDCMLVDFDDDDDVDDFPLDPKITDDDNKKKEKFKIMKYCYENGTAPALLDPSNIKLSVHHIKKGDIEKAKKIYADQTPNINAQCATEPDVMYLLAARTKNNNFPVIQTMHDAFSIDRVDVKYNGGAIIDAIGWLVTIPLYKNLLNKNKSSADKLSNGMKGFANRICPLIRLNAPNLIDDDPAKIANYVASTSQFIKKLIEQENATPPFQVDMIVAIKGIKDAVDDDKDDNDDDDDLDDDDDDDDDDDKKDDDQKDIGDVIDKLTKNDCAFHSQPVDDVKQDTLRPMMDLYKDFRGKLNNSNNKPSPNDKKKTSHKSFDSASYPQNKRFNIFIDRRTNAPNAPTDKDKVTFFEPPHYCDTLPQSDFAPEWFIESARQCLIPVQGSDNTINVTDAYKGEIITFSFHVEEKDKIKCYMFWNGQVQRFYPHDLVKAFKYVFHPDVYDPFIKSGTISKIAKNINIVDKEFEGFYKLLTKKEFPQKISSLLKKK